MHKIFALIFFSTQAGIAQDTLIDFRPMEEVIIKAYASDKRLADIPAAVSLISSQELNRYNNVSILPAMNAHPGIRMEERSPGSYRLNIRGSSLRSPFGVRNVKVYYHGIPFTDPGGNSYLNQFGFYNIRSIEVIREPGSSLYGAGTGGVVLIEDDKIDPGFRGDISGGSYGLINLHSGFSWGDDSSRNTIHLLHLKSSGYRNHTALRRDVISWDASMKNKNGNKLSAHILTSDLYYQTPGALTLSEFNKDPRSSRPRVGNQPGAEEADAHIRQQAFFLGFNFTQTIAKNFENKTSVYGAYTALKNPAIRNFEKRSEPHLGGRSAFTYSHNNLKLVAGAELQHAFNRVSVFRNDHGRMDSLMTDDEIEIFNLTAFAQSQLEFNRGWSVTAGLSFTRQHVNFTRQSSFPVENFKRTFSKELSPRIAIAKKLGSNITAYISYSQGFSPPTVAELLPSTSIINTSLEPERGKNFEIGLKGTLWQQRIYFEVNYFRLQLNNTIVQRRDASGADYFVNAGTTRQPGLESYLQFRHHSSGSRLIKDFRFYAGHAWHDFHYKSFKQIDNDFSGNRLPGLPQHSLSSGFDVITKQNIYLNLSWLYNSKQPLNDANSEYAKSWNSLAAKLGYEKNIRARLLVNLFFSAENIFYQRYSIGYDINAFGGRFYNAAPLSNFTFGISISK